VTIEYDVDLESCIGTMVIHLTPHTPDRDHANLTESNLKTLHSLPIHHSHYSHDGHVSQARSHRSGGSSHGSPAAGAISDLHGDADLKEIITKLPL
jgi:hypothetical protein